ncbi:hypothetical protein APT60_11190 [Pseudomonas aeruginosa]|nr:hypothetical protein APT60_11190 [Pseudomonas aeruginosa]KAJ07608.1 hypothetical protein M003_20625 [Pseudomonas aeruginosa IGB83]KQK59599.1 hypothetical protein AOX62_11535 [Pseudomonas aeruginosa]KQK60466.1 hypothetical protein AOX61_15325 [Pseudomonas aeruginosa]OZO29828.1 hypothetical protein CGU39_18005 [Pseudomonas aeruginosa]
MQFQDSIEFTITLCLGAMAPVAGPAEAASLAMFLAAKPEVSRAVDSRLAQDRPVYRELNPVTGGSYQLLFDVFP